MKKFILYLFAIVAILVMTANTAYAQNEAGKSASLAVNTKAQDTIPASVVAPTLSPVAVATDKEYAKKKLVIKRVLERYGSPVSETTDGFIAACMEYDLNCYLLPSIMGVESTFGKFHIPGTYNAFGWGRGTIPFQSWEESYMVVGKGLRENYINKGATDIDSIGAIYCEGNTWSGKVKYFMAQFEAEEEKLALYFD